MKKIFLLSLLSVFFLSAFSQTQSTIGNAEIITKINIDRNSDDIEAISSATIEEPGNINGWWIFFWRTVKQTPTESGFMLECSGWGLKCCFPRLKAFSTGNSIRGISTEAIDQICEDLVLESNSRAVQGECKGSLTKKIAFNDPETGGRISYLIYQMDWNYDPKNPRNGKAEITIFKTKNLGIK